MNKLANISLFVLCWCGFMQLVRSQVLRIGGFFNPFDVNGKADYNQLQHLSAFILAVNEINQNKFISSSVSLEYVIRSGYNDVHTRVNARDMLDSSVIGVVSGLPNAESISASAEFNYLKTPVVHSLSTDSSLSDANVYPYIFNVFPSTPVQALTIQSLYCYESVKRIIPIVEDTDENLNILYTVTNGNYCPLSYLQTFILPSYTRDFTSTVESALDLDASLLFLIGSPEFGSAFLKQAYDLGLLRLGVTIVCSSEFLTSEAVALVNKPEILHGLLGARYISDFYLTRSPVGVKFVNSFASQVSTESTCGSAVDATGASYLFPDGDSSSGSCIGLSFGKFQNISNVNSSLGHTYDAVYALANAIKTTLSAGLPMNGRTLSNALKLNVSFAGASGTVNFKSMQSHRPSVSNYRVRESGLYYSITNYYDVTNSVRDSFLWNIDYKLLPCNPFGIKCVGPIYNTVGGATPTGYPPYTLSKPPDFLKITGIFSIYDAYGNPKRDQIEYLAAFIMAVNDINDSKNGAYDNVLINSTIVYDIILGTDYSNLAAQAEELHRSYFGSGVVGVVSALPNEEAAVTNGLFTKSNILQINSAATSTNLAYAPLYPLKLATVPADKFIGYPIQHALCTYYNYRKIGVFYTSDSFGVQSYSELIEGNVCEFSILFSAVHPVQEITFLDHIEDAKQSGAQVFIILGNPVSTAKLLEQGYEHGLFKEGIQIFTAFERPYTYVDVINLFLPKSDISSISKGIVSFEYWPEYNLEYTDQGQAFVKRWRQQKNTGPDPITKECNNQLDDSSNTYLYRSRNDKFSCYGLNFTSYSTSGKDINPYVATTYDAVVFLAMSMEKALKSSQFTSDNIYQEALSIKFSGASGLVEVPHDLDDPFTRPARKSGLAYKINNFNLEAYLENRNNSMKQALYWTNNGVSKCSPEMNCLDKVTYNSINGAPPSDTRPDIIVSLSTPQKAVLITLGVLVWIVAIAIAGFLAVHYNNKLIVASQPPMMAFILLGEMFGGARVINAALPITDESCIAGIWMGHLAFFLVFGCLFIKTWRVHKLVNNPTLKRIKITTTDIMQILIVAMTFVIIYLFCLTFIGKPHQAYKSSTSSNQTTNELRCSFDISSMHTALFVFEAIIVIVGTRLCYAVKDVPDSINESKFIAVAITSVLVISALAFPLIFLLNLSAVNQQLVASISFAVAGWATMASLYGPKIASVLETREDEDGNEMRSGKVAPITTSSKKTGPIVQARAALKKLNGDERIAFCKKQVEEWQQLLMCNIEIESSSKNGFSSSKNGTASKKDGQISVAGPNSIYNGGKSVYSGKSGNDNNSGKSAENGASVNDASEKSNASAAVRDDRQRNYVVNDELISRLSRRDLVQDDLV